VCILPACILHMHMLSVACIYCPVWIIAPPRLCGLCTGAPGMRIANVPWASSIYILLL
jgi:hypothetical protein